MTWLARIVLLWGAAVFCKLVSIQVVHHRELARQAKARQELVIEIPAPRGTIFDRSGRPLAMSVPAESVFINPQKIQDLDFAAGLLANALDDLDRDALHATMQQAYERGRGFLWIKRKISEHESRRLRGMQQEWIDIEKESQRRYPKGSVAAHVLGSVDFEEKGNAGIEHYLDDDLRGEPGLMRLVTDRKRRGIDSEFETEARPGVSVTLAIDERVQFVAERELAEAAKAQQAKSASVVVMNPATGEILALASYPSYDPNEPLRPGGEAARLNHAVSVPFEPGSVFKINTFTAALEAASVTPDSLIDCHGGVLRLPGRVIHDSHLGLGVLPAAMVFAKSSNIGSIGVGGRAGQEALYDSARRLGFGQKTGIMLPAESAGKLRKTKYWGTTSWASISIGQEVSVTTVQLAQAVSVIANGGFLVRPRLVLKKGDEPVPAEAPVRELKPETALTMQALMEGVVLHGTGTAAKLAGYSVAGKTGTAQIFDVATHRYTHTYNASFVGFAPRSRPAIVAVVTLNGTESNRGFGGAAAAPVFHAVAAEALRVMEVPKDLPDEPPVLVAQKADVDDLAIADPEPGRPNILEEGDGDGPAEAAARPGDGEVAGPRVPDFRGKTMRAVLAEAAAMGLTVLPDGSGVAREQSPPAGSTLRYGERIRVQFAR